MEAIIVFILEAAAIMWYASTLPVDGALEFALEVVPCSLVSVLSLIVSLLLRKTKRKVYKTIVFLIVWVPIRYKWLYYIYEGCDFPINYINIYYWCNITVQETLVLFYYLFSMVRNKR